MSEEFSVMEPSNEHVVRDFDKVVRSEGTASPGRKSHPREGKPAPMAQV